SVPERLADERLERRLAADRIEVGVARGERPEAVRAVDREPEVLDRVGLPARQAFAARDVVERPGVLGIRLDQLASPVGGLVVLALLVEVVERPPELPSVDLVRLSRRAADGDDRRPRLLCESRRLHAGSREDERAGRRIDPLAVELEGRTPPLDDVELLLRVLALVLVVLVEDPVARLAGRPRVHAEGRDPEVV